MLVMMGFAADTGTADTATAVITPHVTASHFLTDMVLLRTTSGTGRVQLGHLGRGQGPAGDPESVHGRGQVGVARVLRAADPVLRGGAERRRPYGQRAVAGHLDAVDVEDAQVAGVRDGDVRPRAGGQGGRRLDP